VAVGGRGIDGTTAVMAPELLTVPDNDDDAVRGVCDDAAM
jgi:hypothetical protein